MIHKVFDCHLHIENGLKDYSLRHENANIIFNNVENYKKEKANYNGYFKSLIFDYKYNYDYVLEEVLAEQVQAIKIHSRIQKIASNDYPELLKSLKKANQNIPIIYDAFYFGNDMVFQPSLSGLIYLAKELPNTKFIVAHAGGYKVLEYFFHLRELKNVAYDLSFSLQYLMDSSCNIDFIKLIKYTPKEKLFFGSDFPFSDPTIQYNNLLDILTNLNVSTEQIEAIFTTNWLNYTLNRNDTI
ncbi:MAG: amidohydrolase family protein [Bacteroidia bacterium]|nr:amidohydrolase family protein [Bacteroidia bacterium]MBP9688504.1 amidohydrolase family protein [Bacteroidia bacterium]